MTAITIKQLDAALVSRYSGITIDTGNPPASTDVTVFLEEPSSEEFPEVIYPSISIKFLSMTYDVDRAHTEDELFEETDYND